MQQNTPLNKNAEPNRFPLDDKDVQQSVKKYAKSKRRNRILKVLSIVLVCALIGFAGGYFGYKTFIYAPDYTATESSREKITVTITDGETATDIAKNLVDLEVVKSERAFVNAVKARGNPIIQYGKYSILKHQSGSAALTSLLDRNNLLKINFTVTEGKTVYQTLNIIADASEYSYDELNQALEQLKDKLPEGVTSFEGWLFPDTHTFDYDTKPVDILKELIDGTWAILYKYNVTMDDAQSIITKASIIQREGSNEEDMAKIARVIDNRLEADMSLGMDSIVSYGVYQGRGDATLELNQTELDDPDAPYNSRIQKGLPPTPISNPGEAAIAAAVNPAEGNWLYFVTVDPATGKTLFFDTDSDFQLARADYKAWCDAHADMCYG